MVFEVVAIGKVTALAVIGTVGDDKPDVAFWAADGMAAFVELPVAIGVLFFINLEMAGAGEPGHGQRVEGGAIGGGGFAGHFIGALLIRAKSPLAFVGAGVGRCCHRLGDAVGDVEGVVGIGTAAVMGDITADVVLHCLAVDGEEFVAVGLVGGGNTRLGEVAERAVAKLRYAGAGAIERAGGCVGDAVELVVAEGFVATVGKSADRIGGGVAAAGEITDQIPVGAYSRTDHNCFYLTQQDALRI